ncbi:hypothetical protein MMC14_002905 [Varicellaria rhodocarpa]|nr:hypothetical protein [Varicellaria rhodocarpa]
MRFFLRLSQYVFQDEKLAKLAPCQATFEYKALLDVFVREPARYLNIPVKPVKDMIEMFVYCTGMSREFRGSWNGDFKLCIGLIAKKIFIDKEIIIDTVLSDNQQLREELHANLARIQGKLFVSFENGSKYVPTELGKRYDAMDYSPQDKIRLQAKRLSSRDFLDYHGAQVGLLRHLDKVKRDKPSRRFLQQYLEKMDEDDSEPEEICSYTTIIKRWVRSWWREEEERRRGDGRNEKTWEEELKEQRWEGHMEGYEIAYEMGWNGGIKFERREKSMGGRRQDREG